MRHLSKSQVVDLQFYVQEPPEATEATHIFVISITVCSESCAWKAKGVFGCRDIHLEPLFCLWTFVIRVLRFSLRADMWHVKSCHPDKIIQSLPSFSYCYSMVVPWLRKATERLCGVTASHTRWPVRYKWKSKGGWCFEESKAGRHRLLCVNQRGGNRVRWGGKQKDGLPLTSHCGRHSAGWWDVRDICGIGACSCTRDKERIHCQRPQRDNKQKTPKCLAVTLWSEPTSICTVTRLSGE